MTRTITGLMWAKPCERPSSIPKGRPRGRKAAGLRYERDLAAALPEALHGQWFEFGDKRGRGFCQPDLIIVKPRAIFVLEAKYTWTEDGHRQIGKLYKPVLEHVYRRPVFGVVVCKVLTQAVGRDWVTRGLEEALEQARRGEKTVLHWIGAGLGPLRQAALPLPLAEQFATI